MRVKINPLQDRGLKTLFEGGNWNRDFKTRKRFQTIFPILYHAENQFHPIFPFQARA
jgi:hypothetical protein